MAIAVTSLGTIGSTTNSQFYDVTLFRAPAANALILTAFTHSDAANENIASAVTADGLVFSIVTQVVYDKISANTHRLEVWRCLAASPTATTIHINLGDAGTGCAADVVECSGVTTSGTSGSGAVGFSTVSNVNLASSITNFLGSFASTANAVFVFSGAAVNATTDVPNSQYIKLDASAYASPVGCIGSGWTSSSAVTQVFWSGSGSVDRGAIAVEIIADNPAAAPTATAAYYQSYRRRVIYAA